MAASPLYDVLLTIVATSLSPASARDLASARGVSDRTLKSYIAQARNLGADIVSIKRNGQYYYELRNYDDIKGRLIAWIDLEERGLLS